MRLKRFLYLPPVLLLLLANCGQGLPSFMHPTYPAAKYFTDSSLLPLAQLIEIDQPAELTRHLAALPPAARQQQGREGMTLLLYALMNRRKECLKVLLEHGFDPNQNTQLGQNQLQVQPVGIAAGGEDPELLTILLDHGSNPNSRFNDEPALFAAIEGDHYEQMRLLLDQGADINSTDNYGRPPIIALADHNQFDQVAYLIERGADITKSDKVGGTLDFSVQDNFVSPTLEAYKWQQKVKQLLIERRIHFPVPHPGIAFQAKVRRENAPRRRWEATTADGRRYRRQVDATDQERDQVQARIAAAGTDLPAKNARALAAYNRTMTLRTAAEPLFQAWRKTQPDWFPTTNDSGLYALVPTLEQEAEQAASEQAAVAAPAQQSDSALRAALLHGTARFK